MAPAPVRVVFMGTPDFAVPTLGRLVNDGYDIALVITQPDRRKGRRGQTTPPPVKEYADTVGLPVFQPSTLRDDPSMDRIASLAPEIIVVAAYGEILPLSLLKLPRFGCLNVHASLLPRYRGASPISAAILAGDNETGVTIMLMDQGLDTGDIIMQASEPIFRWDTQESLSSRLAALGAATLSQTIPLWIKGEVERVSQNESLACHTSLVKKSDGRVLWGYPAELIERMVRACYPWPLAHTLWNGKQLNILTAARSSTQSIEQPGTVLGLGEAAIPTPSGAVIEKCLFVNTGDGTLGIARLQMAGGKAMAAEEFLRGHSSVVGAVLGSDS